MVCTFYIEHKVYMQKSDVARYWDRNMQLDIVCVPGTTAWRVHRLRMEERPPIWRVAANIMNKQSRTADKGWSSSLGVGRGEKQNVMKYP